MEIRMDYLLIFVMGLYLTGYSVFTDMFWMKVVCLIMGILDLSFIMSVLSVIIRDNEIILKNR